MSLPVSLPVGLIYKGVMIKRETKLIRFIKDECANFDKHYQKCHYAAKCKVLNGVRCSYFERNVLITNPDYKFRPPGYDYSKLFAEYATLTKTKTGKVKQRKCNYCSEPVGYRQRLCRKCREFKRRNSYRNYRNSKKSQAPQLTAF